ncbi:MAG: B12-binding domain-containing radical SAM protein [Caldilineales bacterium]|nr:B12-binding domain-containing radical SAM protein [Caldilineales bacterium]
MAAQIQVFLVNFRNERDIYPPFGIMYVADALIQAGHQVRLFHLTETDKQSFLKEVQRERPLWVGFSTITGPQLASTITATQAVKEMGITTVWGGVHATIMPDDVLREDYVDYVIVNEGEVTAQEFTQTLLDDGDFGEIAGLAWRDEKGGIHINGERPFIQNLDDFRPRWDLLANIPAYFLQSGPYRRAIPVYISRGCPFRCGFCYNEVVMKRTWRQHSEEFVVEQVRWLQEHHGIDAVDYADDYLFGRIKPMQQMVERVGLPWSGQVRVQLLKPEFVQWMAETGCQWVNIGAESGSQAVLDSITKDQKAWQIEWGVSNLAEHAPHIEANLSFIIGLPAEDPTERRVTLDLIERLCDINPNARCSLAIYMPYPGTPLWPDALARGYTPPPDQMGWTEFDIHKGNTPWIDSGEGEVMSEICDILFVGRSQGHWLLAPYYGLLRWRWRHDFFKWYIEGAIKRQGGNLIENVKPLRSLRNSLKPMLVSYNANTHKGPAEAA